jgi:hypothetical protein
MGRCFSFHIRTNDLSRRILKGTKTKVQGMSGDIWICFSCDSLEKSEGDLRAHLEEMRVFDNEPRRL